MAVSPPEIFEKLKSLFGEAIASFDVESSSILVDASQVKSIGMFLRDEPTLRFDFLMCLSGVDNNDKTLSAVYHLASMEHKHKITLRVTVPKEAPHVQTVERVWRTADWHERETFDLVGIIFDGHHDLRRILCPYDWEGHPLQKDYEQPEYYQGMKVPY